jgi:hypothetical protein
MSVSPRYRSMNEKPLVLAVLVSMSSLILALIFFSTNQSCSVTDSRQTFTYRAFTQASACRKAQVMCHFFTSHDHSCVSVQSHP